MSLSEHLSICFVAHFAYGALAGGQSGHIGGVERQCSLMAKWFAKRGYRVSMITWDEGQEDGKEIDGVRVVKMCRKDAGIKGLRFFWPKWTSLVAAMKRADADIYYQNCAEYVTGQVAFWCRRQHRRFIYSVPSDPDCDERLPKMHSIREKVLYRYGLAHADTVIVQTRRQHEMLQTNFGRNSVIVPMPCMGPSEDEYNGHELGPDGLRRVLWVGRLYRVKRPDRLLDLARLCPDIQFDVIGQRAYDEYAYNVCERAKAIPNITMHGSIPMHLVSEFYKNAALLCCTSDFEGFPNTFLEAWSWGIPVVSMFDPDDLIAKQGFGGVGKDTNELAAMIRTLLDSSELWRKASQAARHYYLQNHTVEEAMTRFEQVFLNVMDSSQ
jgi:glycosyltransferase involved in cell wall biosynthesis